MRVALVSLAFAAASERVSAGANSHAECAALVPEADVRRGKSAFFSGCYPATPGMMVPSGCWSPGQYNPNQDQYPAETASEGYGCQTCVMTNAKFAGAVFPVYWAAGKRDHISPCPEDEFNYAGFHGASSVVTAASITNAGECAAGWFYSSISGRCYWKSDRFALADNWDKANSICRGMGAALVTLENAAENDWFVHNLLWPGVMGETFTSLWHDAPGHGDGKWHWVTSNFLEITPYGAGSFEDWYPGMTDATIYATPDTFTDRRSCMEIYPQIPKGWNPFSCTVNKQYACVKQGTSLAAGNPVPAPVPVPPTPAPIAVVEDTDEPTKAPTKAGSDKPQSGNGGGSTKAPTQPTGELRFSLTMTKTGGLVAADGGWIAKDGGDAALYVLQEQLSSASGWKNLNPASETPALDAYSVLTAGCYRVDTRPAAAALADADALAALRWTATEASSSGVAASGYGYDVKVFGIGGAVCPTPALPSCAKTCIAAAGSPIDTCSGYAAATSAGGCSGCGASDAAAVVNACYRAGCGKKSCGAAPSGYSIEETQVLSLSVLVSGAALGSSPYAAAVKDDLEAAVAKALGVKAASTALVMLDGTAAADVFEAAAARRLRSNGADGVAEESAPRRLAAADAKYVRLDFEVTAADKDGLDGLKTAVEDGALAAPLFLAVDGFDNSAVVASDASGAKMSSLNETDDTSTAGGNSSSSSDDGFTSGQKVGIAVGCVAGAAVLAGAVTLLATRKRRRHAMQTAAKRSSGADAPPS